MGSGNVSGGENLSPPCLHLLHEGVVLTISKDSPASILQSLDPRPWGRHACHNTGADGGDTVRTSQCSQRW